MKQFQIKFKKNKSQGISLIEVIVAMAIFALVASSIASMSVGGFNALNQGNDQAVAEALAKEGLGAVKSIREGAWNEFIYNQSGIEAVNNQWALKGEGTTDVIDKFTRTISFAEVCRDALDEITTCPGNYTDIQTKLVTVEVSWQTGLGANNTVEQSAYLTNWSSIDWQQTDWIGGEGQAVWSDTTKYESADLNIDDSTAGEVKLKISQSGQCSGYTWTFDQPANYIYNTDNILVENGMAQLKPVGTGIIGIANLPIDTYEFDTNTGLDADIIHVTGNIYAVAYRGAGNDGFLRTLEIDNAGNITEPYIDSLEFDSTQAYTPDIIYISGDIYAIVYRGRDNDGYLITVEINSSGQITNSLIDSFEYNTWDSYEPRIINVNADIYAIIYRHTLSGGAVRTISIANDGNIGNSIIDYQLYSWLGHYESDIIDITSDIFLISYRYRFCFWFFCWDSGELLTLDIDPNGNIISQPDNYTYYGNTAYEPDMAHVTNNIIAIAFRDQNNDGRVRTYEVQNNGNIVSGYLDALEYDTVNGYDPQITYLVDGYYGIVYHDGSSSGKVAIFDIQTNGQIANSVLDTFTMDINPGGGNLSMAQISDLIYVIAYDGPNSDGFVTTIQLATTGTYPSDNPNIYPVIGYQPPNIDSLVSLNETAFKDGGEIYYQLSDDGGTTWYFWNGAIWTPAVGPNDYNTAVEINQNLWEWNPAGANFKFNAFLTSDGTQFVRLDEVSLNCSNFQIEVGQVVTDENWTRVNLINVYANPVIIASYAENSNTLPASVRITNVADSYFDIRLQEPQDRNLSADEITYLVVEEGVWQMDGVTLEARKYDTNTVGYNGGWNYDIQNYSYNFPGSPIVLHQVMTSNDANWITTYVSRSDSRYNPPGTGSFRIALNGAEAATSHGVETVGWLAIDRNDGGIFNNIEFETYRTPDSVRGHDNGCYSFNYSGNYSQMPITLGYQQQMDGGDGSWSVICAKSLTSVSFHDEEDQANNNERSHSTEIVGYLTFAGPFNYSSVGDAQAYADNGSLISSRLDMTANAKAIQTVSWTEVISAIDCPLCDVTIQIRSADTQSNLDSAPWSGPAGAGDSFINPDGSLTDSLQNGDRWLQYKLNLFGNGDFTPIVRDLKINYK